MKILHSITAIFLVLTVFACTKELDPDPGTSATVVIDCTGTYLQWDGKDYKVCNLEKVSTFQNGATVKVDVKKTEGCSHPGNLASACYMLHKFESWVEVQKIKSN